MLIMLPHLVGHSAAKLRNLLFAVATAFGGLYGAASVYAQSPLCEITSIAETSPPVIPPIARAAHVQGQVILMTSFALSGRVDHMDVLSGPVLLQKEALAYVSGWNANEYGGSRTCAIVLDYAFDNSATLEKPSVLRSDSQHVKIGMAAPPCMCDPAATLGKRKRRFLLF